jgi:hypothetical protein
MRLELLDEILAGCDVCLTWRASPVKALRASAKPTARRPARRFAPEEFAAAFDLPAEVEVVSGAAALALRYLSQGLPGFRGKLSEWSFQGLVGHRGPHQVPCRFWWPRFAAEIEWGHATQGVIGHVHWIDDPGDLRTAILAQACKTFILQPPMIARYHPINLAVWRNSLNLTVPPRQ